MKIQTEPFRKVSAATASDVTRLVDLSADAKAFLLPELSPQGYLDLMVQAELVGDAIRFLAFALPVREAIWWACVVTNASLPSRTDIEAACLQKAAAWVYAPNDQRRRACLAAAEAAGLEGAAAYAALAVFWSGGSLAPEGMADAPAHPSLGAIGAGASILLALTSGEPLALRDRFWVAMQRGVDIANGGNGSLKNDPPLTPAD